MILALISSTLVTHLCWNKNRPMPSWIENKILLRFAPFLCLKPTTYLMKEQIQSDESKEMRTKSCQSSGPQISKKSPKAIAVIQDDERTNGFREQKYDVYNGCNVNKWTQCAAAIERFFLILWTSINLGSLGLIIFMTIGNSYKW